MQVIIPLAGRGSRFHPLTIDTPKPLLPVADRPMLAHLLDRLAPLDVDELILIVGHLGDRVQEYMTANHHQPYRLVEQTELTGTGGAVELARPHVDGPILIVFADTLFDVDLSAIERCDADGVIWVKEVEDYQRFGVVVTDDAGNMIDLVEKPTEPVSRDANIGLFYVANWRAFFDGLARVTAAKPANGEWFVTYAFNDMIRHGCRIATKRATNWYDCGTLSALLATNRRLLEGGLASALDGYPTVRIDGPAYIDPTARIHDCEIGPNVSIGAGSSVTSSVLRDTIVGSDCRITDSELTCSMVGRASVIDGAQHDGQLISPKGCFDAP